MKKKLFVLALVAICVAIVAAGTLAYFTGETTAHNVITTGGVKVELVEKTDGGKPFPEEGVTGVMPGQTVGKEITVKNVGPSEAWIRIELVGYFDNSGVPDPQKDGERTPSSPIDLIPHPDDNPDWELDEDGYYLYYTKPLAPGQTTPAAISSVVFKPEMGNEYQGATFSLDVTVQAVQTANNGETVFEAQGWPETQ